MPNSFYINKYPKTKKFVLPYFHVHQPYRLNNYYSIFDVEKDFNYFGGYKDDNNSAIINRVAELNYRPAGKLFLDLLGNSPLKISYSLTGTVLEQLETYAPDVIDLYREILDTGKMELVCETYYHSLAAFYDTKEFIRQIEKHKAKLNKLFGVKPQIFRNTEFSYRNDVGEIIQNLGFKGIFAEGWDPILDWRSPNYMYRNKTDNNSPENELKLLLKNYRRSDDVAFRFQLKDWEGYPVTADKFAKWIADEPGYLACLCMDYETIGEHHKKESGIFEFYRHLPEELAKLGIEFILPSEAVEAFDSEEELDYPNIVSWADAERDLSAWTGNKMQQKSLEAIYKVGDAVNAKVNSLEDPAEKERILDTWGKLQTSDHFYYMSTKYWGDGDVHKYFSPYETPYQAYITFTNVLNNFYRALGE